MYPVIENFINESNYQWIVRAVFIRYSFLFLALDYRPCNPDIGDECPFLGESMCFEGKCMCINTLVPTTPEGKCKGNQLGS